MTSSRARRRAGPVFWVWLAAFPFLFVPTAEIRAQEPSDTVVADTVPTDTIVVPIPPGTVDPDTLPADSLLQRDSVIPVPPFPRWPQRLPTGWAAARWEWGRDELLRFHGLSLLQLVERIPGLVATRTGDFGSPVGASALGLGGGRLRVYLDGFELDPLAFTTADLQHVGLVDLETVRVERGLQGLRVDLTTVRMPEDARPFSVIEAGTGVYDTKLLRALLMRGFGGRSVVGVAYEQTTTAGFGFTQPFTVSGARVRWSYALNDSSVLQLEYRGSGVESAAEAWPLDASERTLLLRGRSRLRPGLMVDAMIGRATRRPEENDPLTASLSSVQAAARASYERGAAALEAAARVRTGAQAVGLPAVELEGRGLLQPLPWLGAEAEVRSTARAGAAGLEVAGSIRAAPIPGLAAFATLAVGERALGLVRDSTEAGEGETGRSVFPVYSSTAAGTAGARVGADWVSGRASAGVAALSLAGGTVAPFGFARIDRGMGATDVGAAQGLEGYGSLLLPFFRDLVRLDGSYQRWLERGGRPYLPAEQGRAALTAHALYFDGELEPTLRVEVEHRGRAIVPEPGASTFTAESRPRTFADLSLQIRIIDVRAFLVWHNLLDVRGAADLPGLPLPGGRFYYGVHWILRN